MARIIHIPPPPLPPTTTTTKDLEQTIFSFMWKHKRPRIAKILLNNKRTARGITTPKLKLYYRTTIIKTAWCWKTQT